MLTVMLTAVVAFAITFLAIPAIMKVASEKKLYDLPDERKLHTKPIACLGGVGIFIGFFLAILLTVSGKQAEEFQFFFASAILIFFLGLKDDPKELGFYGRDENPPLNSKAAQFV